MYQVLGTLVYLSMSADATCRGIRSPKDGPILFELTQDMFGWPQGPCEFPAWVTEYSWRDLPGTHIYRTSQRGQMLNIYEKDIYGGTLTPKVSMRCVRIVEQNTTATEFVAVGHTSDGCLTQYQCVRVFKRNNQVIQIQAGKSNQRDDSPCSEADFSGSKNSLVFHDPGTLTRCPFSGQFSMEKVVPTACTRTFVSGCEKSSSMKITSSCEDTSAIELQCIHAWKHGSKSYTIVQRPGLAEIQANCLVFRDKGRILHLAADTSCNEGAHSSLIQRPRYRIFAKPETCQKAKDKVLRRDPKHLDVNPPEEGVAYKNEGEEVLDVYVKVETAAATANTSSVPRLRNMYLCYIVSLSLMCGYMNL